MTDVSRCYSIEDLRQAAQANLPRVTLDYLEGGAEDEWTLNRNVRSFDSYQFVPRVLQDVENVTLATQIQGADSSMPLVCAPTGMSRMFHYEGELAVARSCEKFGIPYSLSTVATRSIEEVAQTISSPKFFQIYIWHNQEIIQDFIKRCQNAGYTGLMLAVDLAAFGNRERDLRNGHGRPTELRIKTALSALRTPKWLFNFLTKDKWKMANMTEHLPFGGDALKCMDTVNEQFNASVTWEDAKKIQDQWQGAFLLKGIQCVEDAKRAVELGATGIILSNHGGRQLDGAPSAFELLPKVREAVGGSIEIYIDGGIRRGSDVIKAIALGATACLIGRPYLYGLAAGGEEGVCRSLEILQQEMVRVMKLIGCSDIKELNESYVEKVEALV